jgi:hypothetical protein
MEALQELAGAPCRSVRARSVRKSVERERGARMLRVRSLMHAAEMGLWSGFIMWSAASAGQATSGDRSGGSWYDVGAGGDAGGGYGADPGGMGCFDGGGM